MKYCAHFSKIALGGKKKKKPSERKKQNPTNPFFLWTSWFVAMDPEATVALLLTVREASLRMRPLAEMGTAMNEASRMESEPLGWANLEALPPPYLPLGFLMQAICFLIVED